MPLGGAGTDGYPGSSEPTVEQQLDDQAAEGVAEEPAPRRALDLNL